MQVARNAERTEEGKDACMQVGRYQRASRGFGFRPARRPYQRNVVEAAVHTLVEARRARKLGGPSGLAVALFDDGCSGGRVDFGGLKGTADNVERFEERVLC